MGRGNDDSRERAHRFPLRRAANSREGRTRCAAPAQVSDDTTAEVGARHTVCAWSDLVGRSPQGEAHEGTVSSTVGSARQAARVCAGHAAGAHGFRGRALGRLSGSKLGVGFRHEAVIAGCIVDFVAPSRKLVVEVDGGYHRTAARKRADARRDRRLERAGLRVLRLSAQVVLSNLPEAVRLVAAALTA